MKLIEKIAKNIEFRRKKLDISVDRLSKKADISLSALNKIRRLDSSFVRVETLHALAKALGCKMDDLIQ
ncbi:MAG: helix-turn-helix transcriptional regulator [Candidatus Margulisbacteria bacterium]|nr:helix-turn-helix transcriptional regulator [Candidatus Margulisiibacteriota bacterium]